MEFRVSKNTAQSIVDTVKEFCGCDINFINTMGYIFASTDAKRIGDYHEIGKRVADTGESIEVFETDYFTGTLPGINAPFFYQGQLQAVIGITGNPDEVRQYSELAARVTMLIFRENDYANKSLGQQTAINYIIRSLIYGEPLNNDHFSDFMISRKLSMENSYRTAVIATNSRYNPANLSFIERDIQETLSAIPQSMYRFQYPNEYVLIFESKSLKQTKVLLNKLLDKYYEILKIAIGSEEHISRQNRSYESALLSLKRLSKSEKVAVFDDFDLEILLGSISENVSERYLIKTIGELSLDEIEILKAYYEADMSLKTASEKLYIHKNTLQYRLDKIYEKSSYNPRNFHDATILYLALEMAKNR